MLDFHYWEFRVDLQLVKKQLSWKLLYYGSILNQLIDNTVKPKFTTLSCPPQSVVQITSCTSKKSRLLVSVLHKQDI